MLRRVYPRRSWPIDVPSHEICGVRALVALRRWGAGPAGGVLLRARRPRRLRRLRRDQGPPRRRRVDDRAGAPARCAPSRSAPQAVPRSALLARPRGSAALGADRRGSDPAGVGLAGRPTEPRAASPSRAIALPGFAISHLSLLQHLPPPARRLNEGGMTSRAYRAPRLRAARFVVSPFRSTRCAGRRPRRGRPSSAPVLWRGVVR
jgi:hypothetical protein